MMSNTQIFTVSEFCVAVEFEIHHPPHDSSHCYTQTLHTIRLSPIKAVPKYHKNADEFNRVQRGHQNYLEGATAYTVLTLLGGLKYPLLCAGGSVLFCLGSVFFMKGYADNTLDVKTARYKRGGGIKWIGFMISFFSSISVGVSLIRG